MTEIILLRRKFLMGMAGLLAAPAIVRIESLMPVRSIDPRIKQCLDIGLYFKADNYILNRTIYVRLPNNWKVTSKNLLHING